MFFEDPALEAEGLAQARYKAETLARAFSDLGLVAWAPGSNDWAAGEEELTKLTKLARAQPLAANLKGSAWQASKIIRRGDLTLGLVGISLPERLGSPSSLAFADERTALSEAVQKLNERGVKLVVLMLAAQRGQALRLLEGLAPGTVQVAIVGKSFDQGESNDPPINPELLGETLVVQAPNHLQGLAVIDLHVSPGDWTFADGSGLEQKAQLGRLRAQIAELQARVKKWQQKKTISQADLQVQIERLQGLQAELSRLQKSTTSQIPQGSYYVYEQVEVREAQGADAAVAKRLAAYYKTVNDHNRLAFSDRVPRAVSDGQASYVGIEVCSSCHQEERAVWQATGHAHAYETLSSQHKEYNLDCVSCHVTGYEKPGGSTVTHVEKLTDVQCEVCHGPGSLHVTSPLSDSLIEAHPSPSLCASACHHSPHVGDDWNVAEALPKILGPGHGR